MDKIYIKGMVCASHFWVPTYNPGYIHVVPSLVETLYISIYSVCINKKS